MSTDQLSQLWPWLVALTAPYLGLLKIIQGMYDARIADRDARIADKDRQIAELIKRSDRFEELAIKGIAVAQQATAVAQQTAPAPGGKP